MDQMPSDEGRPWYASGLRFECQECGACCGGFPGFVWVSEREIDGIAAHLGMSRDGFLEEHCRRVGARFTLREKDRWNCVMFEQGCCLVYPVRPLQCRTFPFWDENLRTERSWRRASQSCPGIGKGPLHPLEEIERLRAARD
jgi:Fe-S-cluster containining protein